MVGFENGDRLFKSEGKSNAFLKNDISGSQMQQDEIITGKTRNESINVII